MFENIAAAVTRRTCRGQPEAVAQSPKRIWQRNGGKGMETRKLPVPIPLPPFLCPKFPCPTPVRPAAPHARYQRPSLRLPSTLSPCCAVSALGFTSRRRLSCQNRPCNWLTQSAPPSPCRCRSRRSRCRSRRGAGGRPRARRADTRSSCFPNLCPRARARGFRRAGRGAR